MTNKGEAWRKSLTFGISFTWNHLDHVTFHIPNSMFMFIWHWSFRVTAIGNGCFDGIEYLSLLVFPFFLLVRNSTNCRIIRLHMHYYYMTEWNIFIGNVTDVCVILNITDVCIIWLNWLVDMKRSYANYAALFFLLCLAREESFRVCVNCRDCKCKD